MNLIEIFETFPTHEACIKHLEEVRWKNIPTCPYCESKKSTPTKDSNRHHCNSCNTSYSVTVNTIFHNTKISLQKWFLAITLILNAKKGIAARQLGRDLKVTKDTAWRMAMKIREAMQQNESELLSGIIEMDETYVGGKPRKGKKYDNEDDRPKRGRGTKKTPVVGMIEREDGGRVKAGKAKGMQAKDMKDLVRQNVDVTNSFLVTDEYKGYIGMETVIGHGVVEHKKWYVDGPFHTNSIEGFWALLKRGIIGQYHKVSKGWLEKYIDEFCYRFNNRKNPGVFADTLKLAVRF